MVGKKTASIRLIIDEQGKPGFLSACLRSSSPHSQGKSDFLRCHRRLSGFERICPNGRLGDECSRRRLATGTGSSGGKQGRDAKRETSFRHIESDARIAGKRRRTGGSRSREGF